jgi:hypothetical protein
MKSGIVLLAFGLCCSASQDQATIPSGSAIYVDSSNGLDKSLSAAFQARHLSLRVVPSPEQADYTLDGTVFAVWGGGRGRSGRGAKSKSEAMKLTSKSGEIVWRYTVAQRILDRGSQAVADDCVKHMKGLVGKGPK